jgi:hypothetical protein
MLPEIWLREARDRTADVSAANIDLSTLQANITPNVAIMRALLLRKGFFATVEPAQEYCDRACKERSAKRRARGDVVQQHGSADDGEEAEEVAAEEVPRYMSRWGRNWWPCIDVGDGWVWENYRNNAVYLTESDIRNVVYRDETKRSQNLTTKSYIKAWDMS